MTTETRITVYRRSGAWHDSYYIPTEYLYSAREAWFERGYDVITGDTQETLPSVAIEPDDAAQRLANRI